VSYSIECFVPNDSNNASESSSLVNPGGVTTDGEGEDVQSSVPGTCALAESFR
jgi:hypothetical protein